MPPNVALALGALKSLRRSAQTQQYHRDINAAAVVALPLLATG
jgi:hypothetical protein